MEALEALLRDLESSAPPPKNPKNPESAPKPAPGPSPTRGEPPGQRPEQRHSSAPSPLPPPAAPPPPGLGELERLLRDLSHTQSGIADELQARSPEDEAGIGGSPPGRLPGSPRSAPAAELDRLLAALESFRPPRPEPAPGRPQGAGDQIQPEELGRFLCSSCRRPVLGAVVTALGRTWHPEHFCCSHCGEVLGDQGFLERSGRPFCRRDFGELFGERCRGCGGLVLGAFAAALGGLWHPECFVCQECRAPFPGDSFFQRGGIPLCQRHFQQGEEERG